mgnify:CR=1 FL=1
MSDSLSAPSPQTLDRAGIALRIPHAGRMCLLDRLLSWTPDGLCCQLADASDPRHPMRTDSGLMAPTAIECAAQAMALHASLCAGDGAPPTPTLDTSPVGFAVFDRVLLTVHPADCTVRDFFATRLKQQQPRSQ